MTFSRGLVASCSMGLRESPGLQPAGRQGRVPRLGSWSWLVTSSPRCAAPGGVCVLLLCARAGLCGGPTSPGILSHSRALEDRGPAVLPTEAEEFCPLPQPGLEGKSASHSSLLPSPLSQSPRGAWVSRKQQPGGERLASLYSATQKWGWGI